MADAIKNLFDAIWRTKMIPKMLTDGVCTMVHKHGPTEKLSNYRGLTILNSLSKVLENVLKQRLSPLCEEQLHDSQSGFRPLRRCADQHFLVSELLTNRRELGLPTLLVFIDVKKAYDVVWTQGLWAKLAKFHVSGTILELLKVWTSNINRRARVESELSEPFTLGRGVPQGGVLSPLLYTVFINDLLEELAETKCGVELAGITVSSLSFADDLTLLAASPEQVRTLLAVLDRHSSAWQYEINVAKSAVMVVGTPTQEKCLGQEVFDFRGQRLQLDQDYTCLGIAGSALRGKPTRFVNSRVQSAKNKLRAPKWSVWGSIQWHQTNHSSRHLERANPPGP